MSQTEPWAPLASSNVAAARWIDFEGGWLDVRFVDGSEYRYYGVPHAVFSALLEAPSKGRFVHRHLKGRYDYARL
jgi:hypothetical protein